MTLINGWLDHCAIVIDNRNYEVVSVGEVFSKGKYSGRDYVGVQRKESWYVGGCEDFIEKRVIPFIAEAPQNLSLEELAGYLNVLFDARLYGPKNHMITPFI